jgi:hypothetical protein
MRKLLGSLLSFLALASCQFSFADTVNVDFLPLPDSDGFAPTKQLAQESLVDRRSFS